MSEQSTVSRRRAAALIAGSLAGSTGAGLALAAPSQGTMPPYFDRSSAVRAMKVEMLAALSGVRNASRFSLRVQAFDRLKSALEVYDATQSSLISSKRVADGSSSTLYRQRDAGGMLTTVITRELDAWPKSDPSWMGRFCDLEAAIQARLAIA